MERLSASLLLLSVVTLLLSSSLFAQSLGPLWTKTYGNEGIAHAYSVCRTSDGGFAMAGKFRDGEKDDWDVYVVRTDPAGDTLWTRIFGGTGDEIARSLIEAADGGFVIAGRTRPSEDATWSVYLLKTDAHGEKEWIRFYGETEEDFALAVTQASDGGYVLAGGVMGANGETYDACLLKTDGDGKEMWTRTYGGDGGEFATSVAETRDGGYIVGAATESFGEGSLDFYLIRTDETGSTQWARTYGGTEWDVPYEVRQTSDGGFIAAGETKSFGEIGLDVYLVKTDGEGDVEWAENYGGVGRQTAQAVWETSEGDFIVGGYSYEYEEWGQDIYIGRVNRQGEVLWVKTFGGPGRDIAYSIMQAIDGACVIAGEIASGGPGRCGAYLLKIDQ